ncbi:MAG: recombinase family protein [Pseudomonadota bacterium]
MTPSPSIWPELTGTGRRIGYARVSTKDQKLRMQRDALAAMGCDETFEDHGVSGSKADRQGLDAMLKALQPGDTVVVLKLDRLGRSVLHLADLLVRFQRDGIHFCSISEGINTVTPGGKLVFHVFAAVAEFHRDIIVENTTLGLKAARKRGKRLGRRPSLAPDLIAAAQQLIAQDGLTITEAAKRLQTPRTALGRHLKILARSDEAPHAQS